MRSVICFILILFSGSLIAQDSTLVSNRKLHAGAVVSFNSNGIASIPAFSLGKPALVASISLEKNRFSYTPTLAYGLDLRPWYIDNWLNYKIVRRPKFDLIAGVNISTFGTKYPLPEGSVWEAQRYFAFALTGVYRVSPKNSITVAYWSDNGQEKGTLRGHFVNFVFDRTDIEAGNKGLINATVQIFYINYDGNNDGLFVSPKISGTLRDCPVSVFFQGTQPITSNIDPYPGFRWNVGIALTL